MRIILPAIALAVLLAAPEPSLAHGTEREYGSSFAKKRARPPSPAFSMMFIDLSLNAIGRTLRGEGEDSIEERLQRISRSTAALLQTTGGEGHAASEFASFASELENQSPLLLHASGASAIGEALSRVDALRESFSTSKRLYETREPAH